MSCRRMAVRKARIKRRLSLVALLKGDILPKITVQEQILAISNRISTAIATGPLLEIISTSTLEPCAPDGAAGTAPLSACIIKRKAAVIIGFHLTLNDI